MTHFQLKNKDYKIIEGIGTYSRNNSRLTDVHMLAFNNVMRTHSNYSMQSTLLLQTPTCIKSLDLNKNAIQILFSGESDLGHWICIYYENYKLHIYDSLNSNNINNSHKIFINRLLPHKENIIIVYEKVHQQHNSYDCGVFAIAFATLLINNICPCSVVFKVELMRKHLSAMLKNNTLQLFPTLSVNSTIIIDNINELQHASVIIARDLSSEFTNIDMFQLESQKKDKLAKESKRIHDEVTSDHVEKKRKIWRESKKRIRNQTKTQKNIDITLQRVKDVDKKVNTVLNKRKINQYDNSVEIKKAKIECNNDQKETRSVDEIKKSNAANVKQYRFLTKNVYKKNEKAAAIANTEFNENLIQQFTLGEMNLICPYCKALHFNFEITANKLFSTCCSKGKILLKENLSFPDSIKKLCYNKTFLRLSREYNNKLALASFTANLQKFKGQGPQTVKICGQIYHNVSTLHPDENGDPQHGQLYILDNDMATSNRILSNNRLSREIMTMLDQIIRKNNPYAHSYKMMFEVEQDEIVQSQNNSRSQREIKMILTREPCKDKNRYNIAACNEVAVVFMTENGDPPLQRDVCIYEKFSEKPVYIPNISKHVDPMVYPLIFPNGGSGWSPYMKSENKDHSCNITALQYYKFLLSARNRFSQYLNLGRIVQQYVVDQWVKIEGTRLYYIRNNQHTLRTDLYRGLMDQLNNKIIGVKTKIGKMVILPSSFEGCARNMKQNFIDSTILVQEFGKPTFFLTMTCNGEWPEILENIHNHECSIDRPDIVVKVFQGKLKELIYDITHNNVLGKCIAHTYVIEFQKRGLPHAHILLWIDNDDKIRNGDDVDKFVSAEIPDKTIYPKLFSIVKRFMIHGPCGEQNSSSPCMENGCCTKKFPKCYVEETNFDTVGYPHYRRRNNGRKIFYQNGNNHRVADNRFVVPFNPYLILKYNCHLNVEICSTILCIKYLFKYCYKGHDCATIKLSNIEMDSNKENVNNDDDKLLNVDEIQQYIDTRYVCPPEACHRIFEFIMHHISHAIYRLAVHNKDEQNVYFKEGCEEECIGKNYETTLTAWFSLNQNDPEANQYLYTEINQHYVFDSSKKHWKRRQRFTKPVLSRMYFVSPKERERYFLRLLLLHVRGAKSFEDLRSFEGITYDTFLDAARARSLVNTDEEWNNCLEEACRNQFPRALCNLFSLICTQHNPINARELYEKFKDNFYYPNMGPKIGENWALMHINESLSSYGMSLQDFNLPKFDENLYNFDMFDESFEPNANFLKELSKNINSLLKKQKEIFDKVNLAIENVDNPKYFFIDGPGGSGKSFLLNTIIDHMISKDIPVVSVAWTGIAATLLKGGKTVHTTFKFPLDIDESTISGIKPNSEKGITLKNAKLLIWDEITMASKAAFQAVDRFYKDLHNNDKPFGNTIVILAGDFRQTLPIIRHGKRIQIIENTVKSSQLWPHFETIKLYDNKRIVNNDKRFKQWLLDIGDGIFKNELEESNEAVSIPKEMLSTNNIVDEIFGDKNFDKNDDSVNSKIILTTNNADVLNLNLQVLDKLTGKAVNYYSVDEASDDNNMNLNIAIPTEFINSITPNGLPPHKLTLKIGAIVYIVRNLDANAGLVNGQRLKIIELNKHSIRAKIIGGSFANNIVFLPRITLTPHKSEIPFAMSRRQFPIRLAYVQTINKSQGQTYDNVGIILYSPVFSHGQLYVALSRGKCKDNIKISIAHENIMTIGPNAKKHCNETYTKNIVFKEIL